MSTNKRPRLDWRLDEVGIQRMFKKYCKTNSLDLVKQCLLHSSLDINCHLHPCEERKLTPLMFGCIHGYEDLVKVLCRHVRIDLNQRDSEGFTALHYAVAFQQRQCVFQLTETVIESSNPHLMSWRDRPKFINPNLVSRFMGHWLSATLRLSRC